MLGMAKTIKEVVIETPVAAKVFEEFGIDYCCGAKRTIEEACIDAGITPSQLVDKIEKASHQAQDQELVNWVTKPLNELADYIISKHHTFTKQEIERLNNLFAKVCSAHGERHAELFTMQKLFKALSDEMLGHMLKEEMVLFPYISSLQIAVNNKATTNDKVVAPKACFGTVRNPISVMSDDHDNAGTILRELRTLSNNFTVPKDGCTSYQILFQGLEAFEHDLHQHVHLENNILFPGAIVLEDTTR